MIMNFFFAVISLIALMIFTYVLKINKNLQIILFFMELSELFGVLARGFIIIFKIDNLVGPGDYAKIPEAILAIIIFNVSIMFAVIFIHFFSLYRKKVNKDRRFFIGRLPRSSMLITLILLSIPGILLDLYTFFKSNLFINPKLEAIRINVSGLGPQITLMEIPFTSLLIWYAVNNCVVNRIWWILLILLISRNLFMGSRSIIVTAWVIIIVLNILKNKYMLKKIFSLKNILLILLIIYTGLVIISARGNLLHNGGTFLYWAKLVILDNPINIIIGIYHGSFNGFDGLVSIFSFVPYKWGFHPGLFLYQSLTGLIPRNIWSTKWQISMTEEFTQLIWGWAPNSGGNFMTGMGVFYMDSGFIGIVIGGIMLVFMCYITLGLIERLTPILWIKNFYTSLMAFFMFRFMFAGSVTDAIFVSRLIVEFVIVILIAKMLRIITLDKKIANQLKNEGEEY